MLWICKGLLIGDILSWEGGLSFISSQRTSFAWPAFTFLVLSLAKNVLVLPEIGRIGEGLKLLPPTSPASTTAFPFLSGIPVVTIWLA